MGQVRRIEVGGAGMRLALALGLSLGLAAAAPGGARGGEPEAKAKGLAGKRVVPRHRGFVLHDEPCGRGREHASVNDIYLVERVEGTSLFLRLDGGPSGWEPADEVVPVDRAVEFFSDAIGTNPRDAYAYAMRAKILLVEREDAEHALADCDEAIRLDAERPAGLRDPRRRSARPARSTTRPSPTSRRSSGSAPATPRPIVERAAAYTSRQECDKAIPDFNQAIRLDPKDADAFIGRAMAWMLMKQPDKAIADFDEAIRLNPQGLDAYVGRAAARGRRGRSTRPSPTTRGSSAWSRRPPWRTNPGVPAGGRRRSMTRPSPTSPRPSGSTPRTPADTSPAR